MSKTKMGLFELVQEGKVVAEFHRGDSWLHCSTSGPMLSFQIFDNSGDYLWLANLLEKAENLKQEDPGETRTCQSFEFTLECNENNFCQLFIDTIGARSLFTADRQSFVEMAAWIKEQY